MLFDSEAQFFRELSSRLPVEIEHNIDIDYIYFPETICDKILEFNHEYYNNNGTDEISRYTYLTLRDEDTWECSNILNITDSKLNYINSIYEMSNKATSNLNTVINIIDNMSGKIKTEMGTAIFNKIKLPVVQKTNLRKLIESTNLIFIETLKEGEDAESLGKLTLENSDDDFIRLLIDPFNYQISIDADSFTTINCTKLRKYSKHVRMMCDKLELTSRIFPDLHL